MKRLVPAAVCVLFVTACGSKDAAPEAAGGASAPASAPQPASPAIDAPSPGTALSVAFSLPRMIVAASLESRSAVTEAVFFATAQTGGLQGITTAGTVSSTQGGWQYSPMPSDKLIVRVGNAVHEFSQIQAAGGGGASTAISWLEAPHHLAYHHRAGDLAEATIDETFEGRQFTTHLTGWTNRAGPAVRRGPLGARPGGRRCSDRQQRNRHGVRTDGHHPGRRR
jgi:hypothetical protein